MKYLYYNLDWDERLSYNSRIVYCHLYNRSFFFDKRHLENYNGEEYDVRRAYRRHEGYSEVERNTPLSNRTIAKELGMTEMSYYNCLKNLKEVGYVRTYGKHGLFISTANNIEFASYFELRTETGICGLPLIVYSYMYNLSKHSRKSAEQIAKSEGKESIDRYAKHIAQDLGISVRTYWSVLKKLREYGLVSIAYKDRVTKFVNTITILEEPHKIEKIKKPLKPKTMKPKTITEQTQADEAKTMPEVEQKPLTQDDIDFINVYDKWMHRVGYHEFPISRS